MEIEAHIRNTRLNMQLRGEITEDRCARLQDERLKQRPNHCLLYIPQRRRQEKEEVKSAHTHGTAKAFSIGLSLAIYDLSEIMQVHTKERENQEKCFISFFLCKKFAKMKGVLHYACC